MERIKNFFKDESGASAVEYGLLVSLIAVAIIRSRCSGCPGAAAHLARMFNRGGGDIAGPSLTVICLERGLHGAVRPPQEGPAVQASPGLIST